MTTHTETAGWLFSRDSATVVDVKTERDREVEGWTTTSRDVRSKTSGQDRRVASHLLCIGAATESWLMSRSSTNAIVAAPLRSLCLLPCTT